MSLDQQIKDNEYREMKAKEFTDDGIKNFEQKVMVENRRCIKRYNKTYGTNYHSMDDMCAGFKKDIERNKQRKSALAKQKIADAAAYNKKIAKNNAEREQIEAAKKAARKAIDESMSN